MKINPSLSKLDEVDIYSQYSYENTVRSLLLRYKESKDTYLARIFLHPYWSYKFRKYEVVLVPSTKSALDKRGFNHLDLVIKKSGFQKIHHILIHEGTCEQALKKFSDRTSVFDEIKLLDPRPVKNKDILLFDDIITSGNTLRACIKVLKPHVNTITILTIASNHKTDDAPKSVRLPFIRR